MPTDADFNDIWNYVYFYKSSFKVNELQEYRTKHSEQQQRVTLR